MRKVFISNMLLAPLDREKKTYYLSDDFDLRQNQYVFPLTYIIDDAAKNGDTIIVVTAIEQHDNNVRNHAAENYGVFQTEINQLLSPRGIQAQFIEIPIASTFDSTTFNLFFKQIADTIQDGDILYSDVTFGLKPFSISMFVALAYGAKAAQNVEVEAVIYAKKYDGTIPQALQGGYIPSTIYDITNLYYLNTLAGNAKPGQKEGLDSILGFIVDNQD